VDKDHLLLVEAPEELVPVDELDVLFAALAGEHQGELIEVSAGDGVARDAGPRAVTFGPAPDLGVIGGVMGRAFGHGCVLRPMVRPGDGTGPSAPAGLTPPTAFGGCGSVAGRSYHPLL